MPRGGARQGAGRKATGKCYVSKSVTMHKSHWEELEKLAQESGLSVLKFAKHILVLETLYKHYTDRGYLPEKGE